MGAITSVLLGSYLAVALMQVSVPEYPSPFDTIGFLIAGGATLNSAISVILNSNVIITYISIWFIAGIIAGIFSVSEGNTIRTALWIGGIIGVLSVLSAFLQNPSMWFGDMVERNSFLLAQFIQAIPTALLSVPTAVLVAHIKGKLLTETEPEPPKQIRTVCECGAIYKSKPMLCAECGRVLHGSDTDIPKQEEIHS
jgi:hypothetical protein